MRKILLSLVLCALAFVPVSAAPMRAWSVIGSAKCGSSDTNACTTSAADMTGANLCVANASYFSTGGFTMSSSPSNTWTALTEYGSGSSILRLYYVYNPSVNATMTFTASKSSGFPGLSVVCVSGAAASPFDQENVGGTTFSATVQPGSVTPSEDNELIISGVEFNVASGTVSINASMTVAQQQTAGVGTNFGSAIAYLAQGAAGAINPTWTISSSDAAPASNIATFKMASAGSPSFVPAIINTPIRGGGRSFLFRGPR